MADEVVELLDTKSAAERWRVSEVYIRKLLNEGRVKGSKVRTVWLVNVESLDRFMRNERKWTKKPVLEP